MNEPLFEDRKKAHEKQFRDSEELHFRAMSHALKAVGVWAAQKMSMSGSEGEVYANALVDRYIALPNKDTLIAKILGDFKDKNIELSKHRIAVTLEGELEKALEDITREGW